MFCGTTLLGFSRNRSNNINDLRHGSCAQLLKKSKSILTGLLRCGYCSRKLRVRYSWQNLYSYYYCGGEHARNGERGCIRFSGRQLDSVVEDEIIKVLQPQAIRAAILAEQRCNQHAKEKTGSVYYALEQARYEANRIERQYNHVDPENYLVAQTLAGEFGESGKIGS